MIPHSIRLLASLLLVGASLVRANEPATVPAPSDAGPFSLTAYAAVGSVFAENRKLSSLGWSEEQFDAFLAGVRDSFHGKPHPVDASAHALVEEIEQRLQQIAQNEAQAMQEYFKDPAHLQSYMKEVGKAYHLERTDSGLAYAILSRVAGTRPEPGDSVVITCSALKADAKTELPQLALNGKKCRIADLTPGLAEAVQMMTKNSNAMVVLPPDLSYGTGEWPPGADRGTPLIFMLTLEEIIPGS
jgi:FKBP-type peptidyl-prolyl cis-trans isomerase